MAKSIRIRNFRGFRSAEVEDCRRINVIVGQNGSGKTALLEAIFFAIGSSAEIAMRTRQWRGLDTTGAFGSASQIDQSLWGDLFYNFDKNAKLSINLDGDRGHERQLKIGFLPQRDVMVPLRTRPGREGRDLPTLETVVETAGLSFDWKGPYKEHTVSVARLQDGKLTFTSPSDAPIKGAFFVATHPVMMMETVARFSELSVKGQARAAVEAFRLAFPVVQDVSIEVAAGNPMLFATVQDQRQKIPLNILSAGMARMSALLFAIPGLREGILLIDEVENGFYYKKLPDLWRALHTFCTEYEVQLFASTHSAECLDAASQIAKQHAGDFSLIRAEVGKSGCTLKQFTDSEFTAAVDADLEVR
jgi:hypothetical protein